jgi:hypothetical protein
MNHAGGGLKDTNVHSIPGSRPNPAASQSGSRLGNKTPRASREQASSHVHMLLANSREARPGSWPGFMFKLHR